MHRRAAGSNGGVAGGGGVVAGCGVFVAGGGLDLAPQHRRSRPLRSDDVVLLARYAEENNLPLMLSFPAPSAGNSHTDVSSTDGPWAARHCSMSAASNALS